MSRAAPIDSGSTPVAGAPPEARPNAAAKVESNAGRPAGEVGVDPAAVDRSAPPVSKGTHATAAPAAVLETPRLSRVSGPDYRFAARFDPRAIVQDPAVAAEFWNQYLKYEGRFLHEAINDRTGLPFDGLDIDPATGAVKSVRDWSAPSKISLSLGLAGLALSGKTSSAAVLGSGDVAKGRVNALAMLEKSITTLEHWQAQHPESGGYLPWYGTQPNGDLRILPDWQVEGGYQLPVVDNGEFAWSMLITEQILEDQGYHDLARRYHAYNQRLIDHAATIFFDHEVQKVRGDALVKKGADGQFHYETDWDHTQVDENSKYRVSVMTGNTEQESLMLLLFVTTFGKNLTPQEIASTYQDTKFRLKDTEDGTTLMGPHGSSHELWARLFLPFEQAEPGFADLFRAHEQVRARYFADKGTPGFATAAGVPRGYPNPVDGTYAGEQGLPPLAYEPVKYDDMFAVYGVFPLLLEYAGQTKQNPGLAWLHSSLVPAMQTPYGAREAGTNDGKHVTDCKTIDGTVPLPMAFDGGVAPFAERMMEQRLGGDGRPAWESYRERLQALYKDAFGDAKLIPPGPEVLLPGGATVPAR